jgi:hypothetical protein
MKGETNMNTPKNPVIIEDAKLIFPDFTGQKGKFNNIPKFSILLDKELAEKLKDDGWSIKYRESKDPDYDEGYYFIEVKISFKTKKPIMAIIGTNNKAIPVDEHNLSLMDTVTIKKADVEFRPYNYDFAGKKGVSAYLNTLYVWRQESKLEEKYAWLYEDDGTDNG